MIFFYIYIPYHYRSIYVNSILHIAYHLSKSYLY